MSSDVDSEEVAERERVQRFLRQEARIGHEQIHETRQQTEDHRQRAPSNEREPLLELDAVVRGERHAREVESNEREYDENGQTRSHGADRAVYRRRNARGSFYGLIELRFRYVG
jgi:hypothetical protein